MDQDSRHRQPHHASNRHLGISLFSSHYSRSGLTSSVLGGKNSKEKKVFPALMDSFILSTIFMIAIYPLTAVPNLIVFGYTALQHATGTTKSQQRFCREFRSSTITLRQRNILNNIRVVASIYKRMTLFLPEGASTQQKRLSSLRTAMSCEVINVGLTLGWVKWVGLSQYWTTSRIRTALMG